LVLEVSFIQEIVVQAGRDFTIIGAFGSARVGPPAFLRKAGRSEQKHGENSKYDDQEAFGEHGRFLSENEEGKKVEIRGSSKSILY